MAKKCITCGSPAAPQPYYKTVSDETLQDHASVFNDTRYAAGVVVEDEFQIPAVDEDIQVCVKNLINVVIGSYLWHPSYGSLKIVYWDSCKKKIGLLNEGLTGTAAPGSTVPECTAFVPSSRPCCADQDNFQLFPFLAENFEAPGVGISRTIQVTSTFGLVAGTNVRIGEGVYLLEQINSSLEIVITNEGAGQTPGDTVEARDSAGNLQYLITAIIVSGCSAPDVEVGRVLVCDGDDQRILSGDFEDQVLTLIDPATFEAQYKLFDSSPRTCTTLVDSVNITPGLGVYTFEVDDSSAFTIGEILEAQSSSLRFEITDIDVGSLDVTTIPNPPAVTITLQAGIWICKILTTESLQDQVDNITTSLDAEYLRLDGTNEASLAVNTLGLDKIQTISTDRLLGRDTAGTGDVEELALGDGLAFTGAGTIEIPAEGVTEGMLAPDAATRSAPIWSIDSSASDGSSSQTANYQTALPKDCVVTHLTLAKQAGDGNTIISGTLTLTLYKNEVTAAKTVQLAAGETSKVEDIADESFAAGDTITMYFTSSSLNSNSNTLFFTATAWGYFTE